MFSRHGSLGLVAVICTVLLAAPAGGGERRQSMIAANFTVKTFNLSGEFVAPWQLSWIADGTPDGGIAFTDRGGNAVGVLDPATGNTQRFPMSVITSPNGIAPIDFNRFAVAGTEGMAIFDRSGSGRITQLVMPGTRNFVIASDGDRLFLPDFANNDLRIIREPFSGPADITKFALPAGCRGPTGVIPKTGSITILCQTTNNIVDLSLTGALLRTTPLPRANMGAQEARPAPRGAVFSGFNADLLTAWTTDYPDPYDFVNVLVEGRGPAVPTVGYFNDPSFQNRVATAARFLAQRKRPPVSSSYDVAVASFRGGGFALGTFPNGRSVRADILGGRNLVGSAPGPDGSIFVADATPGRPAIHRVTPNLFGKTGRTPVRFRYPVTRLNAVDQNFLTRMTFPFYGPGPSPRSTPTELQVGIVGSSSSPWHTRSSFIGGGFKLNVTATGARASGGSYSAKVESADTGAFTRVVRVKNIRPNTTSVTLTLRGTTPVPVSLAVHAQTPKPEPCACDSLDLTLGVRESGSSRAILAFNWALECTGGAGTCDGTFVVSLDKAARAADVSVGFIGRTDLDDKSLGNGRVQATCTGDCASTRKGRSFLHFGLPVSRGYFGDEVQSMTIEVERTCGRERAPKFFKIAFGRLGGISERRSDLNGNGVADGKEKR